MENPDELEIKKLEEEIKDLKVEKEKFIKEKELKNKLEKLKKEKEFLLDHDSNSGKEYICGSCGRKFETNKGEEVDGICSCPSCNKINTLYHENIESNKSIKNDNVKENVDEVFFNNQLSEFKTFTILSIFLDFLFIFTIFGFIRKSYLDKNKELVNFEYKNSYSNWNTLFLIIIFLKLALIGLRFLTLM